MKITPEILEEIRRIIIREVFVTSKEERIFESSSYSGESQWIFDFRRIILDSNFLTKVSHVILEKLTQDKKKFQICGLEVASIPILAGIITTSTQTPQPIHGFFIRKSRKKTGLLKMVEGRVKHNLPIIIIDDLINSGGTILKQIKTLEEMGEKVIEVFTIIRFRDESYYKLIKEKNIKIHSLFTLNDFPELGISMLEEQKEVPRPFKALWVFKSNQPRHELVTPKSTPIIMGGHLFFGADNGTFYNLNKNTAEVVWEYKTFPFFKKKVFSSPCTYMEDIFFGSSDGNLYCLEAKTGKKKWVFEDADFITNTPTVSHSKKLLYVGIEFGLFSKKSALVALNPQTGRVRWRVDSQYEITGDPAIVDKLNLIIVGYKNGQVCAYSAKNGVLVWTFKTLGEIRGSFAADIENKKIFFGNMSGSMYALSLKSGGLLWEFKSDGGIYSTPCLDKDCVFGSSLDKRIFCLSKVTGNLIWVFTTGGRVFASPKLINEQLYVGSNDGMLYVINKKNGVPDAFCQLSERITNQVTEDDDGKIYVTTAANEIYCLTTN